MFSRKRNQKPEADSASDVVVAEYLGEIYHHGSEFTVRRGDLIELPRAVYNQLKYDFPQDWRVAVPREKPAAAAPIMRAAGVGTGAVTDAERRQHYPPVRWARSWPGDLLRVSIVSGTWNRMPYLRRMIESVRGSTESPHEFVVVDGGSSDGSIEWLMDQDDVTLIREPNLRGACAAFNNGFAFARGDFVVNLNDDVEIRPKAIDIMLAFMEGHPEIAQGVFYYSVRGGPYRVNFVREYLYANFGMIRRVLGDKFGWWGYDYWTYGGDCELSMQLWAAGYKVESCPEAKLYDHQLEDELRVINHADRFMRENGTHKDTQIFWDKWRVRPIVAPGSRTETSLRLHLGCGDKRLKGWLNLDIDPACGPDKVHDVTYLADFSDNSVDEIYACHLLEHIVPYRTLEVLAEWRRVLRPGGTLRLSVPDLRLVMQNRIDTHADGAAFNAAIHGTWSSPESDPNWLAKIHKQSFVRESLVELLTMAGFRGIRAWEPSEVAAIAEVKDYASCALVSLNVLGVKEDAPSSLSYNRS